MATAGRAGFIPGRLRAQPLDRGAALRETARVPPTHDLPIPTGTLTRDDSHAFACACVASAGLGDRVEVSCDEREASRGVLLISGPDQFGLMGTTVYVTLRVALPATARAIALATARHVLGEFHATDGEVAARAPELPLAIAMALTDAA